MINNNVENLLNLYLYKENVNNIFFLSEMSLSTEIFISSCILQLTFYAVGTTYQRKHGFVILNQQIYYIGVLILGLSTLLILNEKLVSGTDIYLSLLGYEFNDCVTSTTYCGNNSIVNDYLSFSSKLTICLTSFMFLIITKVSSNDEPIQHNFEYVVLILISILGSLLICSSNDLITAYLSIELQSIAFYIMAAFKKNSSYSIESGLKYFIVGSLSSAFFLFGSAIIYGCLGSLNINDIKIFYSLLSLSPEAPISITYDFKSTFFIFNMSFCKDIYDIELWFNYLFTGFISYAVICRAGGFYDYAIMSRFLYYLEPTEYVDELINSTHLGDSFMVNFTQNIPYFKEHDFESFYSLESIVANPLTPTLSSSLYFRFCDFADHYLNGKLDDYYFDFSSYLYESPSFIWSTLDNPNKLLDSDKLFLLKNIWLSYNSTLLNVFDTDVSSMFDLNLVSIGFMLICVSLFIKLALSPFHFWSLDVYEGSPNITTAFFAIVPKIAIFVLLLRICYSSFYNCFLSDWQIYFFFVSVLSIFVGSIGGLEQRKLKTLLAYSSISHTGYLLLAFSSGSTEGTQMMLYYLSIFMLSGLCFWSVFLFIRPKRDFYFRKHNKELGDFVLLRESNPTLALILAITLFSIAGIPPIVGFLAKIGIFLVAIGSSAYLISVVCILFSVASTFYYIRIIKVLYFENVLVGKLYFPISTNKSLLVSILAIFLIILCVNPMILYLLFTKAILLSF